MKTADRDVIRRLATELAAMAAQPLQAERREGWQRLNSLQDQRPMLWITEIPFGEFEERVDELRCVCADARLRGIERALRQRLFTARRLRCDEVCDATWWVPKHIEGADYGVTVQEQRLPQGGSYVFSHHYEPVIRGPEDVVRIRMPAVRHDPARTAAAVDFYTELFGDILPVRACGPRQHFYTAWDQLVQWTGVQEALVALVDRPEFIHAIMRRMTDAFVARMEQLEQQGLLDFPHPLARVGSGAAGFTDELPQPGYDPQRITTMDQWGGATCQIFGDVSPAMHDEFALQYELEIMRRCGLNYYGCCEPVHAKMHLMARIPRLRKISISPWCDVARAAATAQHRYVFSHKPSPAILAEQSFCPERAEADLRQRLAQSGEHACEFIMKDISTVRGDVQRLIDWCELAYRVLAG